MVLVLGPAFPNARRVKLRPTILQAVEVLPSFTNADGFSVRCAYERAAESRENSEVGQDVLAIMRREGSFVFALCDGVSQSFCGDIAARILGLALVDFLSTDTEHILDSVTFKARLTYILALLTTRATKRVNRRRLGAELPALQREVLEEKRHLGSESTFVCARIDQPSADVPLGRITFAWMGDSRLRFWGPKGERTAELGDTFKTFERWSSARGLLEGEPHTFVDSLVKDGNYQVLRILAYSDGIAGLDQCSESLTNADLSALINSANGSASSDDISVIEVWPDSPSEFAEWRPQFLADDADGVATPRDTATPEPRPESGPFGPAAQAKFDAPLSGVLKMFKRPSQGKRNGRGAGSVDPRTPS